MPYVQSDMADNGAMIGKPDISGFMTGPITDMRVIFSDECSFDVDLNLPGRLENLLQCRRSSIHVVSQGSGAREFQRDQRVIHELLRKLT